MLVVAKISVKLKLMVVESLLEQSEKLPPKQPAQDPNGHKETLPTAHPPFAVRAQTTARNDAVQVGMNVKALSPSMQEHHTADFCTQVFWVSTERQ
jgi:hypothetical protein